MQNKKHTITREVQRPGRDIDPGLKKAAAARAIVQLQMIYACIVSTKCYEYEEKKCKETEETERDKRLHQDTKSAGD